MTQQPASDDSSLEQLEGDVWGDPAPGATDLVATVHRLRRKPGGALWVRGEGWVKPQDFGVPLLRTWLVSMKDSVLAIFDLTLNQSK